MPLRRIGILVASLALAAPLSVLIGAPAFAEPTDDGKGKAQASERGKSGASQGNGPDHSSGNSGTSGDPSEPQPPSNADFSGNGANQHGSYDSTRDGSPSGNGNGGGNAVGKPCAGCVGKADNKNPPGQFPDGSDPNAGYECDRNHGIGRTNPAHTGCQAAPPSEPPPSSPPPTDEPPGKQPPGKQPPGAQPPGEQPGQAGGLPVTGGSLTGALALAAGLVLLGGALRVMARRRAT